jgi:hypothetical protein
MTLVDEINKPIMKTFRRAWIKRRSNTTGLYETDWFEITDFVKKWGKIKNSVDGIKINDFKQSGITLMCRNDEGKFNPESNPTSLWYNFMTRFRTLLRIEAGYFENGDINGTELPTDSTQGVFILTDDVVISAVSNTATLKFKSLISVLDEVKAKEVAGLGATLTSSEIVTQIRDHTDGSSNFVFQQFISSGAWAIQTTTINYNLATTTSIVDKSCWELMQNLAEAEGFIIMINRTGGIEFRDRDERTTASQFTFEGQGFKDPNVIKLLEYKEPITKFFNHIRFKWDELDTETSWVTAGTVTTVDPSTLAWKYGTRTLSFENRFVLSQTTAQTIADNLLSLFGTDILEEIQIQSKFCPQLEISDKVLFNYRSYSLEGEEDLWDQKDWASDTATLPDDGLTWAGLIGENFDWNNVPFKIISKEVDLDRFSNSFILRKL